MEKERYVDEKAVSQLTGWSLQTLRNHRYLNRGIPYLKCGRSVRYDLQDVHKFMQSRRIETQDFMCPCPPSNSSAK